MPIFFLDSSYYVTFVKYTRVDVFPKFRVTFITPLQGSISLPKVNSLHTVQLFCFFFIYFFELLQFA